MGTSQNTYHNNFPRVFQCSIIWKARKYNCSPSSIFPPQICVMTPDTLKVWRWNINEIWQPVGDEFCRSVVYTIPWRHSPDSALVFGWPDVTWAGLGGLPVGSCIGLLSCRVPSGVSHMLYVWSCAAGWKVHMYLASPWGTEGRGVKVQQTIQCFTTRSALFGSRAVLI